MIYQVIKSDSKPPIVDISGPRHQWIQIKWMFKIGNSCTDAVDNNNNNDKDDAFHNDYI